MPRGKYLFLTAILQNTAYYLHIACHEDSYWHSKKLIKIQIFERTALRKRTMVEFNNCN